MSSRPLMETRALTRRYGGVVALEDFNIEVSEGETRGLIGPNGAGKTTFFVAPRGDDRTWDFTLEGIALAA